MAVELRYLQGAIVPESSDVESPPQVPTGRRRDYTPSAQPGCRLPHMFVRINALSEVCSTVNLSILAKRLATWISLVLNVKFLLLLI